MVAHRGGWVETGGMMAYDNGLRDQRMCETSELWAELAA